MASCSTNQTSRLRVAKKSTTKNKKKSRQVLPNDIISEIFSLLPSKSICRFKCCSKFFSELTEDKYFLKQQSDNSLLKDDTCFFIQHRLFPSIYAFESGLKIHSLHKQNASSSCGVHTRFLEFLALTGAKIAASSNGLVFCRIYSKLFVCNPTTLSWSYIPSPSFFKRSIHAYVDLQYVFECDSEEMKLFALDNTFHGSFACSIYDPKKGVWKMKKELFVVGDWDIDFKYSVYYRGIIHILSHWEPPHRIMPYIATYDVESGMSRMISIPRESTKIHMDYDVDPNEPHNPEIEPLVIARIFKWGKRRNSDESICLVKLEDRCIFKIWVLSDYEAKRWSSLKQVNLKEMGIKKEDLFIVDFMVMNGDCLLFATKKSVYKYDLVGEREARLEEVCGHELKYFLSFIPYSSTLRSCGTPLDTYLEDIVCEEKSEYSLEL